MATPIRFIVPGVRDAGATRGAAGVRAPRIGRLKDSVTVTATRAAGEPPATLTATPGEDVVVFHIAGGPELWLHPETARDLLIAQQDPLASRSAAPPSPKDRDVAVPIRLQWRLEDATPSRGATRGFLGDVLVKAVEVLTGFAKDQAADFAASAAVRKFDGQVDNGVYQLAPGALPPLKGTTAKAIAASEQAALVLIHGTFSNTSGTFGKLWLEHPQLVRQLFTAYGGRLYALDHPTLGVSPIANAITLAEAAAAGTRLHLLTHSRGGLVAEVLARVCANPAKALDGLPKNAGATRKELQRLASIVAKKDLTVERVVRVACPARGTLLASKRLDAYLSVLKWALELAQVPVVDEFVEFLGEVARRRADPDMIPGLAAQIPDSPLVQWLHAGGAPIQGDLRVVAGDMEGDSVVSWVKTLLSDAFYWTDNDLVVQTRSMYGGSPRETASTFLLDRGGKVSHFNYFSNPQTASGIVRALTAEAPDGFSVIGPLSWGGTSATGTRAAVLPRRTGEEAAALPALFLLPGILGSHLKAGKDRIWLGHRLVNNFDRLAFAAGDQVTPDIPIGLFYDDLAEFLAQTHDVRMFAFDWRRPMTEEAKRLAGEIDAAIDARKKSGKPVRILAHSMGGIVARAVQIVSAATWKRMMAADGARLLMLGTPNGGSWAPMQVLSGDDTFGNLLTTVGAPFRGDETRQLIAAFPGLLQLQADLLGRLGTEAAWAKLAKADVDAIRAQSFWHRLPLQINQHAWGVPKQAVLDAAIKLRRALDKQRESDLPAFASKLLLVAGNAPLTPTDYQLDAKNGVVYLDVTNQGDGRVTLESARLPGVSTWMAPVEHGALPKHKDAFPAYLDLLERGTTNRLPSFVEGGASRGAAAARAALVPNRPARQSRVDSPPQRESDILARAVDAPPPRGTAGGAGALRITVMNGDLTYTPEPLLLGHYRASKLTGAEAAMDRATGGAMSASLHRGLYPVAPGSQQVFLNTNRDPNNPWQLPRPQAVIVAGLGDEGELRGADLVKTVRQAVVAWAQRLTETTPVPAVFTLATTLLGSGGSGITAGQAAQLIAQGVREANAQLGAEGTRSERWPRAERLVMIELYLDRAHDAWSALKELTAASPQDFTLDPVIEARIGALPRPPTGGYRGADYDFISAVSAKTEDEGEQIVYTVNTRRARSDVRPQPVQVSLIRTLVADAASHATSDAEVGRTLFSLLVPRDLEPLLGSSTDTVLELDPGTAAIPWEVLELPREDGDNELPWSIRTKLLRKLRTSLPPNDGRDATAEDSVLVIGDPLCDRDRYPILAGARREAEAVAGALPSATAVISGMPGGTEPDAKAVTNALLRKPYRIIHVAAHGEPPLVTGKSINPRGVVLSGDDCFLGPREIGALRVVPELVFVNCCHLGTSATAALGETNYSRAKFAAGVAQALISEGVRCVVAAGWAVEDEAATVFATTFYRHLLEGARFIDAVAKARAKARECGGNTWAAYQCYGDPDWFYKREAFDPQRPGPPPPGQEFASIASAASLKVALERIAVRSEFHGENPDEQASRIRYLESIGAPWAHQGDVAEAFGTAWMKTRFFDEAIKWYGLAQQAQDGSASLAAIEQLVNARVRAAETRAGASPASIGAARAEINKALAMLAALDPLGTTFERENLRGSAHKRLAMLERRAGRGAAEAQAIRTMAKHYAAAEAIARQTPNAAAASRLARFYPEMNRIAARLAVGEPVSVEEVDAVREVMRSSPPDFWSVVGQTELDVYAAIAGPGLSAALDTVIKRFSQQHDEVRAPRMWASVADNARFVLDRYAARATPGEAAAVKRLLQHLESFGAAATAAPRTPKRPQARKTTRKTARKTARKKK